MTLVAACNGGREQATPPPSTSTTTAPSDPYAVPAVIDEAYVNRVLAALDQLDGDVTRRVVATRLPGTDDLPLLRAIYNDPQLQIELDKLVRLAQRGFTQFKMPPGNRRTTVLRLVTSQSDCILSETRTDYSQVVLSPQQDSPDEVFLVTLRPTQPRADPQNINPTPWSFAHTQVSKRGETPSERARCDP